MKFTKEQKDIISEFHAATIIDLSSGADMRDIQDALRYYENKNEFYACIGIRDAIKDFAALEGMVREEGMDLI